MPWNLRTQYAAFAILALVALGLTAGLMPSAGAYLRRYYGSVHPLLVVVVAAVAGAAALGFLHLRYGFEIARGRATLNGLLLAAALATFFALIIIGADLLIRYDEALNVPAPAALAFYPAIGFVAEMVFHVLPLALLLAVLSPLASRLGEERIVWGALLLVAVAEPTFQIVFSTYPSRPAAIFTWLHVFAFAAAQLYLFKRYDFFSMYGLRFFYYAYWHVIWGVVRLKVLF